MKFNYNKSALIILSLTLIFSVSSCYTKFIWNRPYTETFREFLVTQNGNQAVIIGDHYHYVFDDNSKLIANLLLWNHDSAIIIDMARTKLIVDRANNVRGYATIISNRELTGYEQNYLQSLGFTQTAFKHFELKLDLHGKRYLPPRGIIYSNRLNTKYSNFEVDYDLTPSEKAFAIAVTPITVAVDTTLWIGNNILLAPFKN